MAIDYPTLPGTRIQDRTGEKYGSWTVLRFDRRRNSQYYWLCRCQCGNERLVTMNRLRRGKSSQCGSCAKRIDNRTSNTPLEYSVYHNMLDRCYNPRSKQYRNYGYRGIAVCARWRADFAAFLEDMGPKPGPNYSLDRRDNDGPYSPDNCRWATPKQQNRNRRSSRLLTFEGRTMCVSAWAEHTGIHVATLFGRLRRNWPIAKVLTTPPGQQSNAAGGIEGH